jgi:pyruvate formate lyase activating enzyme
VLETIRFLAEQGKLYAVQQVIVPGFTEDEASMRRTARFLADIDPSIRLRLLRFRPHGVSGQAASWASPSDASMDALMEIAKTCGLTQVERSL